MARVRLSDPGVKERLQERLAAGVSKEALARELGISKVTLYAWLDQIQQEIRQAVATRKVDYAERLAEKQFNLYDELARMVTLLQTEVALLGQAQRSQRTEQRALAIFRGATVIKGYLDTMGELLGQLQPPASQTANVHLTRVEQLLNVTIAPEQVPDHLRGAVLSASVSDEAEAQPLAGRNQNNGHGHAGH